MSVRAILFDLDNTLLENPIEQFIPAYISALGEHAAGHVDRDTFVAELLRATDAMIANRDPNQTNKEVFDDLFFPAVGRTQEELGPVLEDFYAHRFVELRVVSRPKPIARPLMEWVFDQGFQVVIATNPLFPRIAVEERLAWADVPVDEFDYDLITTYEHMHAAKPHGAYYLEIARHLGRRPEECLMVGDEWDRDIQPALDVGMGAFWIAEPDQEPPADDPGPVARGSLADFYVWVTGRVD
ncbi:MAG: HAD-IA family hydrolase [Anaerolineae bacterium]|jgi:HAD superfamily hydrolase (TIGR01549 family)